MRLDCASTNSARRDSSGLLPLRAISFNSGITRTASVCIRLPSAWMRRSMSGRLPSGIHAAGGGGGRGGAFGGAGAAGAARAGGAGGRPAPHGAGGGGGRGGAFGGAGAAGAAGAGGAAGRRAAGGAEGRSGAGGAAGGGGGAAVYHKTSLRRSRCASSRRSERAGFTHALWGKSRSSC